MHVRVRLLPAHGGPACTKRSKTFEYTHWDRTSYNTWPAKETRIKDRPTSVSEATSSPSTVATPMKKSRSLRDNSEKRLQKLVDERCQDAICTTDIQLSLSESLLWRWDLNSNRMCRENGINRCSTRRTAPTVLNEVLFWIQKKKNRKSVCHNEELYAEFDMVYRWVTRGRLIDSSQALAEDREAMLKNDIPHG
ncbi:hypothetical protein RB195_002986 [Necator americanus]|uniref:Uncharacterized protein n=1 Tax=Necator americanus TaxID=51031 RepID=A0ABR1DLQ9_NECAM